MKNQPPGMNIFMRQNHIMPSTLWREAGTMSTGKNGKVGNRGTCMIFVSYANNHIRDCYCMYNPNTGYVIKTKDITWLHHMCHSKPEARNEVIVYPQVALPFEPKDWEARKEVTLNASEPKTKSEHDKKEWSTVCMRLGWVVKSLVW